MIMVRECVFPNCGNKMRRSNRALSFHRLPLRPGDEDTLKLWMLVLQLDVGTSLETLRTLDHRVCSAHFDEDDFTPASDKHRYLKKNAIPKGERPVDHDVGEVEIVMSGEEEDEEEEEEEEEGGGREHRQPVKMPKRTRGQPSSPDLRTRGQPSPGIRTRVQPSPGIRTRGQPSPGIRTRVQPSPGIRTKDQPLPGVRTRVQPAPGLRTRGQPLPGVTTRGQPLPGARTRGQPPPGVRTRGQPAIKQRLLLHTMDMYIQKCTDRPKNDDIKAFCMNLEQKLRRIRDNHLRFDLERQVEELCYETLMKDRDMLALRVGLATSHNGI